jgi:hypothetical protein
MDPKRLWKRFRSKKSPRSHSGSPSRRSSSDSNYSGTKMLLELVRESSDVFVPLKSVAGGLSALLKQYDVSVPFESLRLD